jgi:hypothetical protein
MFWRKLRRGLVKVLLVCEMSKMVNIVMRSEEDKDFFSRKHASGRSKRALEELP